jgi:hypothetical protein
MPRTWLGIEKGAQTEPRCLGTVRRISALALVRRQVRHPSTESTRCRNRLCKERLQRSSGGRFVPRGPAETKPVDRSQVASMHRIQRLGALHEGADSPVCAVLPPCEGRAEPDAAQGQRTRCRARESDLLIRSLVSRPRKSKSVSNLGFHVSNPSPSFRFRVGHSSRNSSKLSCASSPLSSRRV